MAAERTIMIVGNGRVPDGAPEAIDVADVVIRFNDCRSFGIAGRKTDVIAVCNTGRPALSMLGGGAWKASAAVRQASEFWCVRDPAKFAAMRKPLSASNPELDDFCDDYTDGFASFASATGRPMRIIPADVHDELDRALDAMGAQPYVVPSSGAVVIADVLGSYARPQDTVVIAGFSHEGWQWHPFAAEKLWTDDLVRAGRLRRPAYEPLVSASQGA
ncbi:MAG: Urease operon accessory protein [Shinella sp.]|nr:Urease operon accessory protein [Shinella sp.]